MQYKLQSPYCTQNFFPGHDVRGPTVWDMTAESLAAFHDITWRVLEHCFATEMTPPTPLIPLPRLSLVMNLLILSYLLATRQLYIFGREDHFKVI